MLSNKECSGHLLGINEPWTVDRVDLDMTHGQVDVYVGHAKGVRFACPECGQEHPVYDHSAERVWRHLDSCQFMTYLHASPPRVSCSEHGVRQARLPWADEGSRFTHLFEALAVNVLLAANIERAAGLLRKHRDRRLTNRIPIRSLTLRDFFPHPEWLNTKENSDGNHTVNYHRADAHRSISRLATQPQLGI